MLLYQCENQLCHITVFPSSLHTYILKSIEGNGKETLKIIEAFAENDFLFKGSLECSDRSFSEYMYADSEVR